MEANNAPSLGKRACLVVGFALFGLLLCHYGLCWSFYGMGHTTHACNYVGYGIVCLAPLAAIFAFALVASGKAKVKFGWKGAVLCSLLVFLVSPLLYVGVNGILYSIDPRILTYTPLQGWG